MYKRFSWYADVGILVNDALSNVKFRRMSWVDRHRRGEGMDLGGGSHAV